MCCNFNLYYVLYFYAIYFLKFIVHKTNSEMVKCEMVKLTGREKTNMSDADVVVRDDVGWYKLLLERW
jgi:hypothetical protein